MEPTAVPESFTEPKAGSSRSSQFAISSAKPNQKHVVKQNNKVRQIQVSCLTVRIKKIENTQIEASRQYIHLYEQTNTWINQSTCKHKLFCILTFTNGNLRFPTTAGLTCTGFRSFQHESPLAEVPRTGPDSGTHCELHPPVGWSFRRSTVGS